MKKVFFAVFAVVIAVGGSAFTNVPADTIYGNTNDTKYDVITQPYNSSLCNNDVSTETCAYKVTSTGAAHMPLDTYSQSQLENFATLGYVTRLGEGIYSGN